eukprot:1014849_1
MKIQPPGGALHPQYKDRVVIAKVSSNPIQALNDYMETSYKYDPSTRQPTGFADQNDWITYSYTSYDSLWNACYNGDTIMSFDRSIHSGCKNQEGMTIRPYKDTSDVGSSIAPCILTMFFMDGFKSKLMILRSLS